jgi:acyl-CoA dehydrogenase
MEYNDIIEQVRQTIARICTGFPGEYWREKDRNSAYPEEFVQTVTEAGLLACLIPEEYGGSGLPLRVALPFTHKSSRIYTPAQQVSLA